MYERVLVGEWEERVRSGSKTLFWGENGSQCNKRTRKRCRREGGNTVKKNHCLGVWVSVRKDYETVGQM